MILFLREQDSNKSIWTGGYVIPILGEIDMALAICPNVFPHGSIDDGKFVWAYAHDFSILVVKAQSSRMLLAGLTCQKVRYGRYGP